VIILSGVRHLSIFECAVEVNFLLSRQTIANCKIDSHLLFDRTIVNFP
jgi:hypothetical protein